MATKQPGSNTCFVCGRNNQAGLKLDFYTTSPGEVRSEFVIPSDYEGYPGVVHGGIIAAILDETGGRAHMGNPPTFMVTAQLIVRYRKPVPSETPLVAVGQAGKRRGKVAKASAELQNMDGEILADAELVLADIPEEKLVDVDFVEMGWQVYPDEEA